jgi:hypothetical protein
MTRLGLILTHTACVLVWIITMLVLLAGVRWAWSLL